MDKSHTKDDASPLSTSTESETFDTWTLISDKPKDLSSDETAFTPLTPEKSDDDADDAVHVDAVKEPEEPADNRYNDMDDLSDGISIISESESPGRLSPHPELRKRLSELNMLFINVPEPPPAATTEGCCQTLNYDACSERSSDTFHRVEPLVESNRRPRRSSHQIAESTSINPTIRSGFRGLFYVGALLAIVAFISKMKYDAWESVLGTKTGLLTQKINELELNNNLMRAEIDILSKQVKYLTTLSENQKSAPNKPKNSQPRENAFKAWPGNGNKIEEVMITPEDLKKPFKCDGHNNVDLAGMCIDLNEVKDSIRDTISEVNEKEGFSIKIDEMIEPIAKPAENPYTEPAKNPKESSPVDQQPKTDYTPHEHKATDQYENKKYERRENHKKHSKKHSSEIKENDRPRRDRSSEEKDSSAERYKKSKDYKKNEKRMSAEYEKSKREADGYWQEKMMQHRENLRKNNEKHHHERNDKNWYIERGDSREQARFDHKHREKGQR